MTSSITKKSYPVPKIPSTPSHTINNMLHERCGKAYDNPIKAGIAHYICIVFTFINKLYGMIHKESTPSHSMWMTSCGIVSAAILLKVIIVYQILIASAFLVHFILYYTAIGIALFGTGLGVAGMVFFDKDGGSGSRASAGFSSSVRTTYSQARSTVESSAQQFATKDD